MVNRRLGPAFVLHHRQRRLANWLERPEGTLLRGDHSLWCGSDYRLRAGFRPKRSCSNPIGQRSDLSVFQLLLWWHLQPLVSVRNRLDQQALLGAPGTIAGPELPPLSKVSRESICMPPSCAWVWQAKHFSASKGRMCVSKNSTELGLCAAQTTHDVASRPRMDARNWRYVFSKLKTRSFPLERVGLDRTPDLTGPPTASQGHLLRTE